MVTELPPEARTRARYLTYNLNSLIQQMHRFCKEDFEMSKDLLVRMNKAYRGYFGPNASYTVGFKGDQRPDDVSQS